MCEISIVVQAQKYLVCAFFFPSQVKLYKSENLDNPIHTVNLGLSLFFHFPPLLRDGEVRMLLNKISLGHLIIFFSKDTEVLFLVHLQYCIHAGVTSVSEDLKSLKLTFAFKSDFVSDCY